MHANLSSPDLKPLNDWQQAVFCAAIAERLFPNYALFARVSEFGSTQVLRNALDKVWDRLTNRCGAVNFETQMEKVDAVTPDPNDFDMFGVYPALDACVALITTLNQMIEASHADSLQTSQLSLAGIETYLELVADSELSDEQLIRFISQHELVEVEQSFQQALVEQLLSSDKPNNALLDQLRSLAQNEGVSNIGICDDD